MNTCIFHSVNSGLYFWDGTAGLLVDGIHGGKEKGLSPMPEFLAEQLARRAGLFAHVDGVLFTHGHSDHFQRQGLRRLLSGPGRPGVYGPKLPETYASIRPIRPGMYRVQVAQAYVLAKDTVHDGTGFQNTPHQSDLLRMGGETFFIAGDAALTPEDAAAFQGFYGSRVDAGFFNLYQLVSPQGQDFLRRLRPERIFLEHLPFKEDDPFHYRSLARQAARSMPADLPPVEILSHMSWIDGRAAQWQAEEGGEGRDGLSGVANQGSLL